MGGTTIRLASATTRIVVAAGLAFAVLGVRDAGPAAVGALYLAAVTVPLIECDVREFRLPDPLVLPGTAFVALGAVWRALDGEGDWTPAAAAVLCGSGALVVFAVLASGGGLGMGDVKLAAVLAAALAAALGRREASLGDVAITVAAWAAVSLVLGAVAAGVELIRGSSARTELPFGPVLLATFWAFALLR